jgi:nitrile hydratase
MEGPHFNAGWDGYGKIPDKYQPYTETKAWTEPWEADLTAIVALLSHYGNGFLPPPPRETEPFFGLDAFRWAREYMHPRDYMNTNYYGVWLDAIVALVDLYGPKLGNGVTVQDLVSRGIASLAEIQRARAIRQRAGYEAVPGCGRPNALGLYSSARYNPNDAGGINSIGARPIYRVGQGIWLIRQQSTGHTREYPYSRGRVGTIMAYYGLAAQVWSGNTLSFTGKYMEGYADIWSRGQQRFYAPLYSVRFNASDLWGADYSDPRQVVYMDAYEPYLSQYEA